MITYSRLGSSKRGRLGNHLFQIASTIGMALKYGHDFTFPEWSYNKYFENPLPTGGNFEAWPVNETSFSFIDERRLLDRAENFDIDGWRQSERYWQGQEWYVRNQFIFKTELQQKVRKTFKKALSRPCIAISVRRGDFVGNPNYAQIPVRYYLLGLLETIPDWRNYNVILFSDDMAYCRVQFEGIPGVHFADGIDIEQLCLMTLCQHFVISNSTFSWWGAWLGEKEGSIVVRPPMNFAGDMARRNSEEDYWPARWTVVDYRNRRLELSDVTFTIPVFIDHRHRMENLNLSIEVLLEDFDTQIIVGEQGSVRAGHVASHARYHRFAAMKYFHRTKILNDMAKMATTRMVVNWDCDVFIPAAQIWLAADAIRNGADMVYPYDGRFARVPRTWYEDLKKAIDVGIFRDTQFTGKHGKPVPTSSVGGAIMFDRAAFLVAGGENEYMVSFGPEDWERNFRFKALGYDVRRIKGCLYHLDHWCGPNSSTRNPFFKANHEELDRMRAMPEQVLIDYVMTWSWRE